MLKTKVVELDQAMIHIKNGMTVMCGGFGGVGSPPTIIRAILDKGIKDLTFICNDAGFPWIGPGKLVVEKRIKHLIASHIGSNPEAGKQMHEGLLKVDFFPQGTLAEKIRAGGMGLGGILVDVGIGTIAEKGKQKIMVNETEYMIEPALTADVSIVYAKKADPYGNLIYDKTARNMNPHVAAAGTITIAEVEEIVSFNELDPESIVTPGVYVDYVILSEGVDWKWPWELKKDTLSPNELHKKLSEG